MLTYMSHRSDLGYITIGKNQATLNSEWTRNGNTDLPLEGDLPTLRLLTHRPRWGAFVKFQTFWRALLQAVCRITKPGRVIFCPALFPPASSSRHSESEHQITSDAGRECAPPTCRTDYLSRRPQFVRQNNPLSGALMRSAKDCNTESRPPAKVPSWLWRSVCGQSG